MIYITIPDNNVSERKYILEVLFEEFLGLDITISTGAQHYEIKLENRSSLTVKDRFFNNFPKGLSYLNIKNIPHCLKEIDIFAASFFMLTRWEEYVNKTRDKHLRFPASASLASQRNFLNRPVVNEMVDTLKSLLLQQDPSLTFKIEQKQLILTHDVDRLYFWRNYKQCLKIVAGDLLKRRDISLALKRTKEFMMLKQGKIKDPFDTFDLLMDKSEAIGVKSRFYFMSGGESPYDNAYKIDDPQVQTLIDKIKTKGHIIGIHPSYDAYNNIQIFQQEKVALEQVCQCTIEEGREHYLRFEVPTTWQIWEDENMKFDSTCGYADQEGFRCGTGDAFSVFNILTRKKLKLKERPLILMDASLFEYNNNSYPQAIEKVNNLQNACNTFTMLWHNSSIKHMKFYGELLEKNSINRTE